MVRLASSLTGLDSNADKNYSLQCVVESTIVNLDVGPGLTKFWIDQMAFGQPERTCLNIQNVPLL